MTEPTEKESSGRCWDCGYEDEPSRFADISRGSTTWVGPIPPPSIPKRCPKCGSRRIGFLVAEKILIFHVDKK